MRILQLSVVGALLLSACALPIATTPPDGLPARSSATSLPPELLFVGEQGPYPKDGLIEVYREPFTKPPLRITFRDPFPLAVAPNGDLIVGGYYRGFYAIDPPYNSHPRKLVHAVLPKFILFDHSQRLFLIDESGVLTIFDPPYNGKPSLTAAVTNEDAGAVLDAQDNLYIVGGGTPGGGSTLWKCSAPRYTPCQSYFYTPLRYASGGLGIDRLGNLYTAVANYFPSHTLGELDPPYTRVSHQWNVTVSIAAISITPEHRLLISGASYQPLLVFPGKVTKHPTVVPQSGIKGPLDTFTWGRGDTLFVTEKSCVGVYPAPYRHQNLCLRAKYTVQAVAVKP